MSTDPIAALRDSIGNIEWHLKHGDRLALTEEALIIARTALDRAEAAEKDHDALARAYAQEGGG